MTTKILAIDTATDTCSVALKINDSIIERHELAPQKQSELILPMIQAVLTESGLDLHQINAIAFGCGPGSFTGIRLATSIAQGLCFGANLPAIPISTLQAMAQGFYRTNQSKNVIIALDARMQEIYFAAYQADANGLMQPIINDCICKPNAPLFSDLMREQSWDGIGSAWQVYHDVLQQCCAQNTVQISNIQHDYRSRALDITELALIQYNLDKTVKAEDILPVYLQNNMFRSSTS